MINYRIDDSSFLLFYFPSNNIWIRSVDQCCFTCNDMFLVGINEGLVHRDHMEITLCLDNAINLMYLMFTNKITNSRCYNHDFKDRIEFVVDGWDKLLANDNF